jgi:cyclopropane-fatty-acyl-phospholipid synthase
MSESSLGTHVSRVPAGLPGWVLALLRRRLLSTLSRIGWGSIEVCEEDTATLLGHRRPGEPHVRVDILDRATWGYLGLGGSVGAGQSYALGLWQASDLTDLVRIVVHARDVLDAMDAGFARLSEPFYRAFHRRRPNTRDGSRANIAAHYDLGDDFFALMLDPTMMYSSAIFTEASPGLESAQIEKLDRICRKVGLAPGHHVMEIGTGWGGFAVHAAQHFGARVTTTTISRNQLAHAVARVERLGLGDRVRVLDRDYRDLAGEHDALVSIEMIEAIGHEQFDAYFAQVARLLAPGGLALVQAITIEDGRFERYKTSVDFIKRCIFPGGCLPSVAVMRAAAARAGLRVLDCESIREHYVRTLRCWRDNFRRNADAIRRIGHGEAFLRQWEFYLAYCEGGFERGLIDDVQLLLEKPRP